MQTIKRPTKCAECPFARHIEGNRYVCTAAATSNDVVRGHWEPTTDCISHFEKADQEQDSAQQLVESANLMGYRAMKVEGNRVVVWAELSKTVDKAFYVDVVGKHSYFVTEAGYTKERHVHSKIQVLADIEGRIAAEQAFTSMMQIHSFF